MTDSENDAYFVQKEIEQRLIGILEDDDEIPLPHVLSQLATITNIVPGGTFSSPAAESGEGTRLGGVAGGASTAMTEAMLTRQVFRAIKRLPQVEIITDPLRGTSVLRRAVHIAAARRRGTGSTTATGVASRSGVMESSHGSGLIVSTKGSAGRPVSGAAARPDRSAAKLKKGMRFNEIVASSNPGRVGYVCVADEFKLEDLAQHYDRAGYSTNLQFDVLHVTTAEPPSQLQYTKYPAATNAESASTSPATLSYRGDGYGSTGSKSGSSTTSGSNLAASKFDLFLFDYGVVVWWGTHNRAYRIVETDFTLPNSKLTPFMVNRYQTSLINDNFPVWCTFSIEPKDEVEPDKAFADRLKYDHFDLPNESPDVKLCISHALGQSGKIDYLELKVEQLNHRCKPLPRELKERGWVTISERNLLQLRGEVLFLRLMLKSGSDLLDEPDLFWQHPWLKPLYNVVKEAFQISERVETLDTKLSTANEILSMISDQFNQRHGSRLEWIVIWLVAVEVIIGVLELFVDARPWLLGFWATAASGH